MASVYTNDLRLEEIGSGEQSGSWGDTTNTNLELIAEAFAFGTEGITTNADTHATTIADGATDPGRALFLKYTGALDSACTITLGPNTVSKLWFIENGTSGSQNIIISQGSGANVTIPAGQTKAVYSNGAGSGAAIVDAFATLNVVDLLVDDDLTVTDDVTIGGDIDVDGTANLDVVDIDGAVQIDNTVTVGVDGTGYDVKFFGDTASAFMLWDQSGDDLILGGAAQLGIGNGSTAPTATLDVRRSDASGKIAEFHQSTGYGLEFGSSQAQAYIQAGSLQTLLMTIPSDITIDAEGDIILDSNAANWRFKDDGTSILEIGSVSSGPSFYSAVSDADIRFKGNDGGSAITALTLDMSAAGAATFNSSITYSGDLISSTAGTSNFRAGVNAGNSIQSGGNYNVAVGDEAGTAITTGDQNSFLGSSAGVAVTTGANNVGIGYAALASEDEHGKNTAIGVQALATQNAGADAHNVAVGFQAGEQVTTGEQNTLIGALAGDELTDADYNTAVGQDALHTDTLGSRSVAIGRRSLYTQNFTTATDNYNVGVGFNAGYSVTTGVQNTFVGGLAGDGTDDGTNNVAVGFEALSANCGSSNVAVGCRAGKAITGASNTVVGLSAGTNVSSGEHNTLMGKEAGTVIEAGDYNVIIGADSDTDHQNAQSRLVLGFGVENPTDNSVRIGSGGNFISNTFTSNATWAHSSDERLKENIQNDTLGLSFIKDLRPVTFTWKRQADVPEELKSDARFEKATGTHHGIIAQEVKSALDTAGVSTFTGWSSDEGDGTQLVSESMFVYPLVKAVQELSTALDAALARIATLEG